MLGRMMERPLLVSDLVAHAARVHGDTEVVSAGPDGRLDHSTWADVERNARRLASALGRRGVPDGARCGTLAWNDRRHLEIYFGVAGGGWTCHTINPRLGPETIAYIVNHAGDRVLFFDRSFVAIIEAIRPLVDETILFVLMDEAVGPGLPFDVLLYDDLVGEGSVDFAWPVFEESRASSLCYTSGTTGHPKGVLYTHRSTMLHTLAGNQPDGLGLSARDTVLPAVPMFHVNAWGVPYIAAGQGARLVLPGPRLDGDSLLDLMTTQGVTMALGVPTIWMGFLASMRRAGRKPPHLERAIVGGAALTPSMMESFRDDYGIELIHAWGMTETSPIGSVNRLLSKHAALPPERRSEIRLGQGRPPFGVSLRIVDEDGIPLPFDGAAQGSLQVAGPWIVDTYFKADGPATTADGWFDTGDIATIDANGYVVIRDRSKDIIKSGGEWISSAELEAIAMSAPHIANAAAIAARHPKWDQRPIIIATATPGSEVEEQAVLDHYRGKVPSWQIPDRVIFVDALPLGGTGKVLKGQLRETFGDVLWDVEQSREAV